MKREKYILYGVSLENIRNAWETKVIRFMEELFPEYPEFDFCSLCIQDVYALSLNQLSPKYKQEGTILLQKEYNDADFRDVIEIAIKKVIENPNHSG